MKIAQIFTTATKYEAAHRSRVYRGENPTMVDGREIRECHSEISVKRDTRVEKDASSRNRWKRALSRDEETG